ncbi:lipase family protein [Fluviicola sp.]|uniref:lipase family protein n=1 Tax=Fluviicola sp. TaxID=1917219 RepID=UPI00260D1AF3|nr:lipase family protein [Fluviicola sp.]
MKNLLLFIFLFSLTCSWSQMKPGYDKHEAIELLKVNFRFIDSTHWDSMPAPQRFALKYRSKTLGFDNKWDYWEDQKGVGVLSLRGTTGTFTSWGANFYAGMIPAKGWIKISEKDTFYYELSKDPKALVHVGWTTALGCLWKDMDSVLFAQIDQGKKEFYITGHSQGGALAYLLTAHLLIMKENGIIPSDVQFKTYCSAAPKPGNLYFAYYYEKMTQQGWAYNTVNALDWVPESPFSIQTVRDFNAINPFQDAKKAIKKLPLIPRLVVRHMYNKMDRPTKKSQKRFEKYLGRKLGKLMTKNLKGFEPPQLSHSSAFTRCGNYIILYPDVDYYRKFPQDPQEKFMNHMLEPYLLLLDKL